MQISLARRIQPFRPVRKQTAGIPPFKVRCAPGKASGAERVAIEVKSTRRLTERHFYGLKALREEKIFKRFLMVSFDATTRRWDEHFECWPVEEFLIALSEGEFDETES
jgi:hypothetical protein